MMMRKIHPDQLHLMMSGSILILGFIVLMILFMQGPDARINAMFAAESPYCDDGTRINDCSSEHIGNMCVMSHKGPRLEYSPECLR